MLPSTLLSAVALGIAVSASPGTQLSKRTGSSITANFDDLGNDVTTAANLEDIGVYEKLNWRGIGE
jgi:hypothetical protein